MDWEMSDKGKKVRFEGVMYTDGETYEVKSETKSSGGKGKIIESEAGNQVTTTVATETVSQAGQSVVQAVVAQAQSMGASGLVAMGSAGAFQANHIFDNSHEVFEVARPMVAEFVDTGTITPPETSKYAGEVIPTTQSFAGIKVGEARKQAIAEKAAEKAATAEAKVIEQEVKQAAEAVKEAVKASEETKAKRVEAEQEKAKEESREEAVEQLGEEKVKELEEKLNEPIPPVQPPTPDQQNAIREAFRNLFNRDDEDTDATPI
jgi:hypothetical protein